MALDNELVVDLLTYIEQVEKLKIKPAFSVGMENAGLILSFSTCSMYVRRSTTSSLSRAMVDSSG